MKVLIACEESQEVCKAFRAKGHEAYSCDIQDCSGGHPEWHIKGDVLAILNQGWDLIIAHPPCTYLSASGAKWYYHPEDKHLPTYRRRPHPKFPNRHQDRCRAIAFFLTIINADCPKIAVENPIGIMSSIYGKPNQIIQPYEYGHEASKATCLWLKGLPNLVPTNIVSRGEFVTFKSGKKMAKWYSEALSHDAATRAKIRNKTFRGIAEAMANQWSI